MFAVNAGQEGKEKFSRITIVDQGDYPIEDKRAAEARIEKLSQERQDAAWKEFFATHRHDIPRLALGRATDTSVGIDLRDSAGRLRIRLAVQPDGKPVLQFFDESGRVVREFTGATP